MRTFGIQARFPWYRGLFWLTAWVSAFGSIAQAQVNWTGNTSTDWSDGTNWSTGSVPTSTSNVILDQNSGNQTMVSTGPASSRDLTIGKDSSSNINTTLTIANGQLLTTSGNTNLGDLAHSIGTVTVSGTNSAWTISNSFTIGNLGAGTLNVLGGASVDSHSGFTNIGNQTGSVGIVVVDGANSIWNTHGNLNIGNGANGSLTISNGGNVSAYWPSLNNGTLTITGTNSIFKYGQLLTVGQQGTGTLIISNGGYLNGDASASSGTLGANNGQGIAIVTGANSAWSMHDALTIGFAGSSQMTIARGASVTCSTGSVSYEATVIVTDYDSIWNVANILNVGATSGSMGNLTVANGGVINMSHNINQNQRINIGGGGGPTEGGSGAVLITGAGSTLNASEIALEIGHDGGTGNLTIANGGTVTNGQTQIGYNFSGANGTVLVTDPNSTWNIQGNLYLGETTNAGYFTIANSGQVYVLANMIIAQDSGSIGVLNLNSNGILAIGGTNSIQTGLGAGTINLAGGSILVNGSNLTTTASAILASSTASGIDTNGLNASWSGLLSGGGSLIKTGAGTLTLSHANTYTGTSMIAEGILTLDFSVSGAPQANIIKNSNTLVFDGGALNLNGALGIANSQTFANTSFAHGSAAVVLLQNNAASLNLNLGVTSRNPGATVDFSLPAVGAISLSNTNLVANVLTSAQGVAYATVAGTDWATFQSGKIAPLNNYQTDNNPAHWNSTDNVSPTATVAISANQTINSLRLAGSANQTLIIQDEATLTSISGGLLIAGTGSFSLTGGSLASGAPSSELVIFQYDNTNPFLLTSRIADGASATILTKSGPGMLIIGGSNTYSGGTVIDDGTLSFDHDALGSGPVTFSGGTLQWAPNNTQDISSQSLILTLSGGSLDPNGNAVTLTNSIGGGGAGNLTVTGNGVLVLTGNNSNPASGYTGATIINQGVVQFSSLNNFGQSEIIFNNGTIQWAPGSSEDVSTKQMLFNTGGAIFDTNGNDVILTRPMGLYSPGGLTKSGLGTLTLTNQEPYSGDTVINGGTLQLGDGFHNGMVSGNIVINNFENLIIDGNAAPQTYSGVISGTGSLSLIGGNLTLTGANTFSGVTLLSPATELLLQNSLALQNSTLLLNTGTLDFWPYISSYTLGGLSGNLDLSLTDNFGGSRQLIVGGNNLSSTYSGNITGTGNISSAGTFTKAGNGTLTMAGDNTYTGRTKITGGTLVFANSTSGLGGDIMDNAVVIFNQATDSSFGGAIFGNGSLIKTGTGNLSLLSDGSYTGSTIINDGTLTVFGILNGTIINNSSLVLHESFNFTFSRVISGTGTLTQAGSANLTLSASNSYSGITFINSGTLIFTGSTNALRGNISDNSSLIFNQSSNNTLSVSIYGNGTLTKLGNFTLTLSGNNTYTGDTTISAGTLSISNNGSLPATGTGKVNVSAGAKLAGTGLVAGNITINGTLIPGGAGSAGLLIFGGDLSLEIGSSTLLDYGGMNRGTQSDAVNVIGNLTLAGNLSLSFINGFTPAPGTSFNFFQVNGTTTGSFSNVSLPAINSNLTWNISNLAASGTISADAINYAQWVALHNLTGNDALPTARPYGGLANYARYAMNLGTASVPSGAPSTTLTSASGAYSLVLTYRVRKAMTDCQLVPQYSVDLAHWTNVDAGSITQLADANTYTAQYQASVACPNPGTVFLRVVAQPAP